MIEKYLYITLIITTLFLSGCTSVQPTVIEPTPTPVTVVPTFLVTQTPTETVGPVPTNDVKECFDRNKTTPDFCYDTFYWVRPTITPAGMGYTARVWQNDSCVYRNRTSDECEQWGDDSWTAVFLHNLTVVRNITGVNLTEIIAATAYYNDTFGLSTVNGAGYDSFLNVYWDGMYPAEKYNKSLFAPDSNIDVVVKNETFDPKAW